MQFEWDLAKAILNKKKHGISFQEACYVFTDSYASTIFDVDHSVNEERWITIGIIPESKILVVVHTYRKINYNKAMRIISARKATKKEIEQYYNGRPSQ